MKYQPYSLIEYPSHYVEGRTIEPIEVIEMFQLCHHLGCAVKYIARAGRKTSFMNDLKKAEWYLSRENYCYKTKLKSCCSVLGEKPYLKIETIIKDWGLSGHLEQALLCILKSRIPHVSYLRSSDFPRRRKLFDGAIGQLRMEMFRQDELAQGRDV